MNHEEIRAAYEAHLNDLRKRPWSPAGDEEETACRRVIDALAALRYRAARKQLDDRDQETQP